MSKPGTLFLTVIALVSAGLLFSSCHHNGRHCGDDFPDKVLKRMDKHVAKLGLNASQQQFYNGLREEVRQDIIKIRDDRIKTLDEAMEELNKDKPDMAYLVAAAKKKHENMPALFDKYADRFLQFYNILDAKQQKQVVEKMKKFGNHFNCN